MKQLSIALALVTILSIRAFADAPASQPAPAATTMDASDTKGLIEAAGKTVTVKGEVSRSFATKSILLINFKGADKGFCLAIPKSAQEAVNAGFSGDAAANLKGKTVLVTGEIKLYKDKPEIEVTKPEQIQLETK